MTIQQDLRRQQLNEAQEQIETKSGGNISLSKDDLWNVKCGSVWANSAS